MEKFILREELKKLFGKYKNNGKKMVSGGDEN